MAMSKNKANITKQCVACGCCVKVCPFHAVSVYKGIRALVDTKRCVGCGKCADVCPASVIQMIERKERYDEIKALV